VEPLLTEEICSSLRARWTAWKVWLSRFLRFIRSRTTGDIDCSESDWGALQFLGEGIAEFRLDGRGGARAVALARARVNSLRS
jgi:hypothetical protein